MIEVVIIYVEWAFTSLIWIIFGIDLKTSTRCDCLDCHKTFPITKLEECSMCCYHVCELCRKIVDDKIYCSSCGADVERLPL